MWGRLPWYLLGQDLSLQERIDGGQAAVLVAGPASADPVPFILYSCEEAEGGEREERGPMAGGVAEGQGERGEPGGLSRNKGNTLGGGSWGRRESVQARAQVSVWG